MAFIKLDDVSVEFPIYEVSSRSIKKQLMRLTTGGALSKESKVISVKALNHISLDIQAGDRVGLIGHNGAGKSTLLRVLAKIYEPTSGRFTSDGKVSALLDVMLGMDPESTGYENIIMRGLIHGLTRKQILEKQQDIADFTDLGDYLAMPIRTYSSGMRLRLAFSIATSVLSEIIILDEVVGAGDAAFMKKAEERLNSMLNNAEIVVLASHSDKVISDVCNKAVWLDAGQVRFFGPVAECLEHYNTHKAGTTKLVTA